jgi:hypothetical protein
MCIPQAVLAKEGVGSGAESDDSKLLGLRYFYLCHTLSPPSLTLQFAHTCISYEFLHPSMHAPVHPC